MRATFDCPHCEARPSLLEHIADDYTTGRRELIFSCHCCARPFRAIEQHGRLVVLSSVDRPPER